MRDPQRIDRVINLVKTLWKQSPDLRLCQLISNLGFRVCQNNDVFHVEDDALETQIKKVLKDGWEAAE